MPGARWISLLVALAVAPPALARDLGSLGQLLTPAYMAMNYAVVCASHPSWAVSQPIGGRGTALHYAEHIKDEIIAGLSHEEAVTALRTAADAARADIRRHLRDSVIAGEPGLKAVSLKSWCEGYASGFIRKLIEIHDDTHEAFLEQVARSKLER